MPGAFKFKGGLIFDNVRMEMLIKLKCKGSI